MATETGGFREPLPPKSLSPNGTLPLTVGEPKKQQATHGDTKASLERDPRAIPLAKATEQRARLASAQTDLAELKLPHVLQHHRLDGLLEASLIRSHVCQHR
jgi:hypothetical protein